MESVLALYDDQLKKNMKSKVQRDNEELPEFSRVRRHKYKYKGKHKSHPNLKDKLLEETTNDEDISIEIDEDPVDDTEVPTLLTIKLGKKVRMADCDNNKPVRSCEDHRHGHVRQH